MTEQVALDLFAGTGWGVACQWLGVKEEGVEIMPEAIATREHNGMKTAYYDAWESDKAREIRHTTQIASPPCQTFSPAGKGTGRKALDQVVSLIHAQAYLDIPYLKMMAAAFEDERTGLVLAPMHYAARYLPTYIAWEQVPTVLPVWEECAVELRELGYSVWTGYIHSEQYGVPQTRKRAYLIARRDGKEAKPPTPTHSKYYSHDPARLDPRVEKWVSMGEALGWYGFTAEKAMGKGMVERYGTRPGRADTEPAFTLRASAGGMEPGGFVLRSNYGTGGDASKRGERPITSPAPTLTSKADRNKWDGLRRMTIQEAAVLQSYPHGFEFKGKQFLQVGNAVPPLVAKAVLEELWT